MSKNIGKTHRWLAVFSACVTAAAAFGQSSPVGREVAIPMHLKDGEEFTIPTAPTASATTRST